jgi:beta-lactamase superfamily II metal-dependent hydrolase
MIMFFRFILGLVFWQLSVALAIQKSTLEICFFDTGQGNCIAVRANNVDPKTERTTPNLIFIDCGATLGKQNEYGEFLKDKEDARNQRLVKLFEDISGYGILITHNHMDHNNLIETIRSIGGKDGEEEKNVMEIRPMSEKVFKCESKKENDNPGSIFRMLTKDWVNFYRRDLPYIENSLGPRVRVVPMRPEKWKDNKAQNPEHDFNMMYLVEFAGRRILFTGDASPQLLTQIMNDPRYAREIKSVDFLVLPHHGSNRSGELMTFPAIRPEMCIVCSNPDEQHHLPWEDVGSLPFKNGESITVAQHSIDTAGKSLETKLPMFVTCSAAQGYYELVIKADGTAIVFDGPIAKTRDIPCFRSL